MNVTINQTIPMFFKYFQDMLRKPEVVKDRYFLRVINKSTREVRDVEFALMTEITDYGFENRHDKNNVYYMIKRDGYTQKEHIVKLTLND